MTDSRPAFLSLTADEAVEAARAVGYAAVHAMRLRRTLLAGGDPMADEAVPERLRQAFDARFAWLGTSIVTQAPSSDGSCKVLLRLADGRSVEAVHLPGASAPPHLETAMRPARAAAGSACVSSQVGCAMACRFCASGLDKVARNLTISEILEQVVHLRRRGSVERIVFMGSGEPTQNLQAVAAALDILRDEAGIGPRHVIVSTVGPASAIDRLTATGRKFTLALSLHSARAATRAELIPTQTKATPVSLLDAADRFAAATGRPFQVEMVLLAGINDGEEESEAMATLLAGRRGHLSAIRWNRVEGMPFETTPWPVANAFVRRLRAAGISATLRRTVGQSAGGACGQLRARQLGLTPERDSV